MQIVWHLALLMVVVSDATTECPRGIWTYRTDYLGVECKEIDAAKLRPVNAIDPHFPTPPHLAIFQKFRPWRGRRREGFLVDFLGLTIPHELYCNEAYNFQIEAHAIRTRQCDLKVDGSAEIKLQFLSFVGLHFLFSDRLCRAFESCDHSCRDKKF